MHRFQVDMNLQGWGRLHYSFNPLQTSREATDPVHRTRRAGRLLVPLSRGHQKQAGLFALGWEAPARSRLGGPFLHARPTRGGRGLSDPFSHRPLLLVSPCTAHCLNPDWASWRLQGPRALCQVPLESRAQPSCGQAAARRAPHRLEREEAGA